MQPAVDNGGQSQTRRLVAATKSADATLSLSLSLFFFFFSFLFFFRPCSAAVHARAQRRKMHAALPCPAMPCSRLSRTSSPSLY
ncbi:hypothetical protein IWZ03DRAFT_1068 [Phyllosticta citriasiana]|uniref:Uncharacterized protein n=1 Tax=Phyllosticta citriasiana TaxID=595635 RepID=A0ABR1KWQ2_9PEZI